MKMSEKSELSRKVTIRFKPEEYSKVNASFRNYEAENKRICSLCLTGKPVTVYTRSQSIDDLMAELILVKNELSAIGNNFNQTVKRLQRNGQQTAIKIMAFPQ